MKTQPLMPVKDVIDALLSASEVLPAVVEVGLSEALNYVLAQDVIASLDVPPADNSAMDGYAVKVGGLKSTNKNILPISQRILAGDIVVPLLEGSAARIFTGASVPLYADAVVAQEECELQADGTVLLPEKIKVGQHIRLKGQDVQNGQVILTVGKLLRPQEVGLLASVGVASVLVYKPLRVGVFSTGNELIEPGDIAAPGKIYNSNRYTLSSFLKSLGMDVIDYGIMPDSLGSTISVLEQAAKSVDVVISSGGVSVGEADFVRTAIEQLGELSLWRIAIKPGKPFTFGRIKVEGKPVPMIGLPGNPSAVLVTLCVLVRPYLMACQGIVRQCKPAIKLSSGFSMTKAGSREEYLRVRWDEELACLQVHDNQSSGMLSSASWADGLAKIEIGKTLEKGDSVEFFPFTSFFSL